MRKKINTSDFIEKAKKIHGDKYNYSLVEYVSTKKKVKIICQKHGEFEQTPNSHISKKSGCPKCSNFLTTNEFIEKAKNVHNNKYDYSLVEYKNNKIPIKIICKTHGIFEQTPGGHLSGNGCQKCGKYLTTNKFIKKAKEIHGNKYDYSLVDYIDTKTPVKIICKLHGIFEQKPSTHLKYCNCPTCSKEKLKSTKKDFISKAKKIHGNKYDYSLVDYKFVREKVKIICPKHGIFEQSPDNHKKGKGCPICKESYGEKKIRIILKDKKIKYIKQFQFENCKYKRKLYFDFYLPEFNTCIEYDGLQHFICAKHWGGEIELKKQKIKDSIKDEYCKNNNINLLRIKYDENIKEILTDYFKNNFIK